MQTHLFPLSPTDADHVQSPTGKLSLAVQPSGMNNAASPPEDDTEPQNTLVPDSFKLLSPGEVQEVFNRSDRTIRRWVERGLLMPVRMGRSLFFRHKDIERIILDQLRKHGSG